MADAGVFSDMDTSNPVSKCGEILRANSGKYVFLCFHCAAEFGSAVEIMQHIEEAHFPIQIEETFTNIKKVSSATKTLPKNRKVAKPRKNFRIAANKKSITTLPKADEIGLDQNTNGHIHLEAEDSKLVLTSLAVPTSTSSQEDEKEIVNQLTIPHNGMHECTQCGIHISGKAHFRLHMEFHANKKPHKCDVCNRGFNLKSALRLHQKMHKLNASSPPEDKPDNSIQAPLGKLIKKQIRKRKLSKNANLTCDVCGLTSVDHPSFVQHAESHTSVEPYVCKICNDGFSTLAGLNEHRRNHKGKKAVQCKLCDKSFFSDSTLESHMKSHGVEKPNKCDECGRTYVKRYALLEHIRTHTGEKPYNCFVCGKSFARRVLLRQHERIHTGEMPFKCRYCDLTFTYGASRRAHEKNKHPEM